MMMSDCPVCRGQRKKDLGEKDGFKIYRCSGCGSIYTGHLSENGGEFDYSEYYDEGNLSTPAFINQILKDTFAGFETYRENGRLLDVGCGAGTLLDVARESGWEPRGVEVSLPAVQRMSERGLDVFHGTLQQAAYPDGYFDIVTASEVIEHVSDPADVLKEISRVLKPGGLLWMTTPNGNGLSARLLGKDWSVVSPPEHLHLFSARGLRDMVQGAGFSGCRVATTGLNPVAILGLFRRPTEKSTAESEHTAPVEFDRVQSGYALNEWMVKGKLTRNLKGIINAGLNLAGLGDNLKIWANTPRV
jgi:SAM-dependent methyltransferase